MHRYGIVSASCLCTGSVYAGRRDNCRPSDRLPQLQTVRSFPEWTHVHGRASDFDDTWRNRPRKDPGESKVEINVYVKWNISSR